MRSALGKLTPGERLPSIRELAEELELDAGTVARAYRELEAEGVIVSRRGSGSFIAEPTVRKRATPARRSKLETAVDRAILEGLGMGFSPPDIASAFTARLSEWRERREPSTLKPTESTPAGMVRFSGSHDLAVELLANQLKIAFPDIAVSTSFVGSLAGLVALECGGADIAGAHLYENESGQFNIPFVRKLLPNEAIAIMNLVQRVQGLMVRQGNPKHIISLSDLANPDITYVNRQKGSGTRIYLDSQLLKLGLNPASITGYGREETTHVGVASAIANGQADAGLGAQSAAAAAGLDFIPLIKERYDLIAHKERFDRSPLAWLAVTVRSRAFKEMLGATPGYDTSDTGEVRFVGPPSHQTEASSAS
jgi:putative molybdopterin biosynthesis protein